VGRFGNYFGKRLEADILRWKTVGGGTDRDGNTVQKPSELVTAELLDSICEKYGKLPSEVFAEDISLLKMLDIVNKGRIESDG